MLGNSGSGAAAGAVVSLVMAPAPVNEHTEEFEQLAGLAALEVLEGEEQSRFE